MSDDWNLKDKKFRIYNSTYGCEDGAKGTDGDLLEVSDIETLRKKLIEDIIEFYNKEEPRTFDNFEEYFKYRGQKIIDEIINKRFGVEE